jgi:formylmethanofuran dehydrogenase subunit E
VTVPIGYTPIGRVRSPHETPSDVDHDAVDEARGRIVVDEAYEDGLEGLEAFSHVVVLAHLDDIEGHHLTARPPHADDVEVGVFATRSPHRPNPIAQTVVEIRERDGATLAVRGLDLVDGTPVLDLKPHVPAVDDESDLGLGWIDDL